MSGCAFRFTKEAGWGRHSRRAGRRLRTPGGVRRRHLGVVAPTSVPAGSATCAGCCWRGGASRWSPWRPGWGRCLPGVAPFRGGQPVGLAAGAPSAGRAAGHGVGRRRRGWWTTPASPRTATTRWGCSASTRARWARRPTASWGCRSTPSPRLPAARWTGGCSCPSAGTPRSTGGQPVGCPSGCGTGRSGSWCWTCWTSWPGGGCGRRCWSPTPATARWASSGRGWMIAGSAMWCGRRPIPAPTRARATAHRALRRAGPSSQGPLPRQADLAQGSSPFRLGSRRAWS
jgi:hypothetical protein